MEDLKPLLLEMQRANALQTAMLKEKRNDDTAKQLFMGNMFEIFTQYDIFRRRNKEGMPRTEEKKEEDKQEAQREQKLPENIADNLIGSSSDEGTISHQTKIFMLLLESTLEFQKMASKYYTENIAQMGEILSSQNITGGEGLAQAFDIERIKIMRDNNEKLDTLRESLKKTDDNIDSAHETTNPPPPSAAKEGKKEEQTIARKMAMSTTDKIVAAFGRGFGSLGDKIKKLTDGIIGKSGLVTLILLGVLAMVKSNNEVAKDIGAVIVSFGALFKSIGLLFTNPGELFKNLGTYMTESFAAIATTIVFFLRKRIFGVLFGGMSKAFKRITSGFVKKGFGTAVKRLGFLIGRFIAFPLLILTSIYEFITTFARKVMRGEGFFSALGSALYASVIQPIVDIFLFIGKVLSLPMILIGNMVKELFRFLSAPLSYSTDGIGARLTQGMPFFDSGTSPSTPSTNLSPSAMGPTGGNTYNFNTVNAPTVASTNNHHHSNISITDSQAETTGLG